MTRIAAHMPQQKDANGGGEGSKTSPLGALK